MNNENSSGGSSRREFLRNAAATAAATVAATGVAKSSVYSLAPGRVIGANDRISVGHVGLGGQGMTHVRLLHENSDKGFKNNTQQIACCDIYNRRLRDCQKYLGLSEPQTFTDYRKLVELKDIDAVWVTTSDQWHTPVALAALESGKHVYVEKPMCKTMTENFALYDTVKRTGRVLQVGSQGCSDPKWHATQKYMTEAQMGTLLQVQGSYCRNGKDGEWNYYTIDADAGPHQSPTADGYVNWDVFRKGTEPKEWDPDRYFRWRKYWEYGSGLVGDLLPHKLHPALLGINLPTDGLKGFPYRVTSTGGLYVQKINPVTKKVDREVPDFISVSADIQDGPSVMVMSSCINETGWPDMVRGNKATMTIGGDVIDVTPERVWADDVEAARESVPGGEPIERHENNFLQAIRGTAKPNCGIDLAVRVESIIALGELAYRHGKTMHFDAATRKVWG